MPNPIALAIPGFVLLMVVEFAASRHLGKQAGPRPVYRWADALTDLGCGLSSQVTGVVLGAGVHLAVYQYMYHNVSVMHLDASSAITWIFAFIAYDFLYYLWHWASHRVNLLWAAHVVHHQSEDYNLAVALRQAMFTPLTSLPFYLPLACIGVSPFVYGIVTALNLVYQFWIHTRLVPRLGPLEWVFNTPSHHRVHHGVNPLYIDKNHGGVFIAFDRIFGTFQAEKAEPVYGVVEGWPSYDAIAANLHPWRKLWDTARQCRGWDKLLIWVAPPEWRPAYLGGTVMIPEPTPALRFDPQLSRGRLVLGAAGTIMSIAALSVLLWFDTRLGVPLTVVLGTGVLGWQVIWGRLARA